MISVCGEWLETVDGGIKITRQLTPFLTGRLNSGVVVNAATVAPDGLPYEHSAKESDTCTSRCNPGIQTWWPDLFK